MMQEMRIAVDLMRPFIHRMDPMRLFSRKMVMTAWPIMTGMWVVLPPRDLSAIVIACTAATSLATITNGIATTSPSIPIKNAVVMCLNTIRKNVVAMYLSTTLRHAVANVRSIITLAAASTCLNITASAAAAMYQNTTTNTHALLNNPAVLHNLAVLSLRASNGVVGIATRINSE